MKWFKHQSGLRYDPKIRRLIAKYGVGGYGVYNFILEAITQGLETESPMPELEDTPEDIALYLRMEKNEVEKIIHFCVQQGLFENNSGVVTCNKIYKYIDKSSTRSSELRRMIENYQTNQELPPQKKDLKKALKAEPEQEPVEPELELEAEVEAPAEFDAGKAFALFWSAYPRKVAKGAAETSWKKIKPDESLFKTIMDAVEKQKKGDQWTREDGKYIPHPTTWLNQKRWLDDVDMKNREKKVGNSVPADLRAKGVYRMEGGKYYTERGTEFDPFSSKEIPF